MTTIAVIGAGEVGSQLARAAVGCGYSVVLAGSRGPETPADLVAELGPAARAATAAEAAAAGDLAVLAHPYRPGDAPPVAGLAMWQFHDTRQTGEELERNLRLAGRSTPG